ncbi:TonB-dependent receptor plug domain-containing protein [Desulfosoma sp.]
MKGRTSLMKIGLTVMVLSLFVLTRPSIGPTHAATPIQEQTYPHKDSSAQIQSTGQKSKGKVKEKASGGQLEPIVVTASRMETPISQVTKSVSVVSASDRDERQQYFLPDLFSTEPGVILRRLGGPGQWSNISLRGAGSQHTQFQYNGFPLRDAADTQSTLQYFIEDLYSGSNLRQVEILKGTQSTLYGSQAMGGVINILPETWKHGTGAEFRSEVGERNTFLENGRFYHGQDLLYFDFNPMYIKTDGLKNGGDHDFWYNNFGFTAGGGLKLTPNVTAEFSSVFYDADLALSRNTPSLDKNGNLVKNTADPKKHRKSLLGQYGLKMNHVVSSLWDYSLKGAYTETQRHYFWSDIPGHQSNYDGSTGYLETQHNVHLTDRFTLLFGADYESASYDGREPRNPIAQDYTAVPTKEAWYSWDLFSQASLELLDDALLLNIGGRFNNPQAFDSKVVGEASAAYFIKNTETKFRAQVGTGYRTPSLYEIYGGFLFRGTMITIGNPDLKPEESLGYEFGVEQTWLGGMVHTGLTWFHTDFDDLITYDGINNKYMNATKAKTEGFETYMDIGPWEWIKLSFSYTYVDPMYQTKEGDWKRRTYTPRNKVGGVVTLILPQNLTVSLRGIWVSERIVPLYDPNFKTVNWKEPSYTTVDAALTYTFFKKHQLFLKVENLFDEDYTESGYGMPGRWVYGGFKAVF